MVTFYTFKCDSKNPVKRGTQRFISKIDLDLCIVSRKMIRYLKDKLNLLICIKIFILKLQARNPEKLLQADIQSPTRIKISINQMCIGNSLKESFTEARLRYICIGRHTNGNKSTLKRILVLSFYESHLWCQVLGSAAERLCRVPDGHIFLTQPEISEFYVTIFIKQ